MSLKPLTMIRTFEPTCQCQHCKSYRTIIAYTNPKRRQRGHRCHDCQRSFKSQMLDTPAAEPCERESREARERVKSRIPLVDQSGYWIRIGKFIWDGPGPKYITTSLAVYRCALCDRTSLLKRGQFSNGNLCDCNSIDSDNVLDRYRTKTGMSVCEAARKNGVSPFLVYGRIKRGWSPERALAEPSKLKKKKGDV